MKNRILSFLFALVLVHTFALTVFANHPVPDLSKNGSLTFVMNLDDVLLDGGHMNLYKVGDIAEEDGNYSFCLVEALRGADVDLSEVTDPAVASRLVAFAKAARLPAISVPIAEGRAAFTDLSVGLYVVWQADSDATKGFSPIQPFLISIPRFQNGEYILDVLANPKVPIETEPTEPPPPPPPPPPNLPQSGQLNWPIPLMAVSGCILFVLGLILYSGRKDAEDET